MSDVLETTVEVLEKVAEYFDAIEQEKEDQVKLARERMVNELKSQIKETLGQEPEEDLLSKLSHADTNLLEAISSLVKRAHVMDEMGEPGFNRDGAAPTSLEEAAELSEQRLIEFCSF